MGALSKIVKKPSEAKVVVRAAVKEPAKEPAKAQTKEPAIKVAAILEWDDGWDDPHSNFTSNETCIYCKEAPHAKRDFHWIGNPDRLDGKIFGGYHQDCYYNWDKKSRIAANKVPATERPGMDDGSCSGFKRAEPKRGRIPPDALCECGQPYNMHGTGAGDIDEIEIVNEPITKPATVVVKTKVVESPKAPASLPKPVAKAQAPKPEVKPVVAPKAPQTAPKPSQTPASPAKGPPSKEERITACKANPKAEHKFIAVSVGKPAKTAICLGCGKEWQDNVHTKN